MLLGQRVLPCCVWVQQPCDTPMHTHTHTHTPHSNEFFKRFLFHQISLKVGPKHVNCLDESAPQSSIHNLVSFCFVWFYFVLLCMCTCMYLCIVLLCLVFICWRVAAFSHYQIVHGLPPPPLSNLDFLKCWCSRHETTLSVVFKGIRRKGSRNAIRWLRMCLYRAGVSPGMQASPQLIKC